MHREDRPVVPGGWFGLSRAGPRRPSVSVVIPTLNEAANLPYVLPDIPHWVDEVILVDGGSTDGTVDVARRLVPDVRVVGQERPGKGAALQAGWRASTGDIIVTLDADGSANPREIPAFVGSLVAGADYAKGSRFMQGGGTSDMELVRRAGNWALQVIVKALFGSRYSDLCYGYNAFWRRCLPALDDPRDGFEIETYMNVRALVAGLRVVEVASFEDRRIHGTSHLSAVGDGCRVLRTIVRERFRVSRFGRASTLRLPARPALAGGDPAPPVEVPAGAEAVARLGAPEG